MIKSLNDSEVNLYLKTIGKIKERLIFTEKPVLRSAGFCSFLERIKKK
jgi:hypothetical protein